jgi:hypothetical protein
MVMKLNTLNKMGKWQRKIGFWVRAMLNIIDKLRQRIEPWAEIYKWTFVMILALVTIASIHDTLSQRNPFLLWLLWIALGFFVLIEAITFKRN